MPGHDRRLARRAVRRVRQEIKGETVGIFRSGGQRKPQPQQRVKQAMLGVFDFAPMHEIFRVGEIGDGAVMAAGSAKDLGLLGRH
jgi:hypothetical protein